MASVNNNGATASGNGQSDDHLPSQYKVLTITFNQDCTALAMGTMKAYSLFTINQKTKAGQNNDCGVEPFPTNKYLPFEEVRIIERLFSSSLVALVSDQSARKLNLFHFRKGSEVYSTLFPSSILAIKMNRLILAICLEESITLFDLKSTLRRLHTISGITANTSGLCALSPNNESPYLAYPGNATNGEIHIFNTDTLREGVMIRAHDGPLAAMSFDMTGAKIATASNKGTVIRVHNAADGALLHEFRRGVQRVATIYSLAFSPDSNFLATSSNTGTVHIFRLNKLAQSASESTSMLTGALTRMFEIAADYLPKQPSEVLTQDRSFATVHLTSGVLRTTIAMNTINGKLVLFIAGYDGYISGYEVNTTVGGECKRISHDLLFNMSLSSNHEANPLNNASQRQNDEPQGNYPPNLFKNDNTTASKSSE